MKPAYVGNAADKKQVKEGGRKERDKRKDELADLKAVLDTDPGRRVMWRLMEQCKVFGSIWESSAKIHYNAGQQDLGHYLMGEVVAADEDALFKMMQEAKNAIV